MLDAKRLRQAPDEIETALAKRGFRLDRETMQALDTKRKVLQVETENLQARRNANSKAIGQAKSKGEDASALMQEMQSINEGLSAIKADNETLQAQWQDFLYGIPNTPHESVPMGTSEADNELIRTVGDIPKFDFTPRDHVDLLADSSYLDLESAAKISGARFSVLTGPLARLQRGLVQFMLDLHTESHGYIEHYVPYLVQQKALEGTGQLPKFADDLFATEGRDYYLIPSAEVPLTNMARDIIFDRQDLPKKLVAHTPCFRSEAGSYGKDTRGIFRQHQFEKVELVQMVHPDESYAVLERLLNDAEKVLQLLGLPYQVVNLCGGDLSAIAAKTYDIEVWLPGQQAYREVSSCSNFEDYQARRLQARFRCPETNKPRLIHTLNGSGLAAGRTLIAILENYQDAQGHIHIPEVLWPYVGDLRVISKSLACGE